MKDCMAAPGYCQVELGCNASSRAKQKLHAGLARLHSLPRGSDMPSNDNSKLVNNILVDTSYHITQNATHNVLWLMKVGMLP